MTASKFTPGPWRASGTGAIMAVGGQIIAMPVNLPLNEAMASIQTANNHLIAAAPDLYEALNEYFHAISRASVDVSAKKCRAALAKARGETA